MEFAAYPGKVTVETLTVGLAIENSDLWEQTHACLVQLSVRIVIEHHDVGDLSTFLDRLERIRPDVVLLDISGWKEPLDNLVSNIRGAVGNPMIIALSTTMEADTILSSFRAGINEYLFPPLHDSLKKALERRSAADRHRHSSGANGSGKALAFFSAKGGCGATTLVCHVAAELGRRAEHVLLVDLDLNAGMVGFITKTKPVYSILDAINNLHRLDIHYWKALVSNGIPGVDVVASPLALASKQQPTDDQVRQVLAFARPRYNWTLVDLGHSLSRLALAALDEIDEACLVTTLDVPATYQAKLIVQTLMDNGYRKNRIRLILNRAPKRLGSRVVELEKMLGLPIFFMIPDDYPELDETYAEGRMLGRNSGLGKQISRLSARLAGLDEGDATPKKPFRLFR